MCITFIQRWTNVEDVGPTLYKCCTDVLCLLGMNPRVRMSPHVIRTLAGGLFYTPEDEIPFFWWRAEMPSHAGACSFRAASSSHLLPTTLKQCLPTVCDAGPALKQHWMKVCWLMSCPPLVTLCTPGSHYRI